MIARKLVTHRGIHVPRGASLAYLIDQAYGYLTSSEGTALMNAITSEPCDSYGAAVAYLRSVGIVVVTP